MRIHFIVPRRISFYMKLIAQLLKELGAEEGRAVTVCPGRLAYFRGVTAVLELTEELAVSSCGKLVLTAEGEGLAVESYFQGDVVLRGNIRRVSIE